MELHRCAAAYMSDLTMISTALSGFQGFRTSMAASLDHAMWFHAPFRADEFMLYECRSTRTSKFHDENLHLTLTLTHGARTLTYHVLFTASFSWC